ncbi:hypothetical protein LQW54_004299 [Pestalotiopsis sp. IQ-011]
MSADAAVNPLYSEVKADADAWAVNTLQLEGDEAERNARADLAYLSATGVPRADAAGLRLLTDWNHWEYGVEHNLITRLKNLGLSLQAAVDVVSDRLDDCYHRWYKALAEVPIYGSPIDKQVLALLQGFMDVAIGTLHWSFHTGRYLGEEGPEIKRTRLLKVTQSVAKQ